MNLDRYVVAELGELAAVRRAIVARMQDGGAAEVQQQGAAVAATELVTNALVHGGGTSTVCVELSARSVRVGVRDEDSQLVVVPALDRHRVGGNGLRLVDALADEWGSIRLDGGGKEVWFRVAW